ncbi:hypothetical protein PV08_09366 [Exophiala spinifera]|uniref:Uncharacterized protein n=1 Tax=Exophiala spinifera TaxID=91928 RepID=A0A0D1ZGJ6_9EURO|nr:uncharacterized protein PV08_09366 [Exophiala spinifera]KIW12092.1 hypothetical protein PV08_09366 [Exophiala spinifera]
MSFGFSLGDFIALAKLVEATRKRFKGAPAEYAALADETRTLQIVVNDLKVQIEDDELADSVKANLQSAAASCDSVLADLNAVIDSHTELASINSTPTKPHSPLWKRLKWDPAEASKLRSRLVSAVQLLKAVLDSTQLNNIAQGVQTLAIASDATEARHIADWLAPSTYSEWQSDYFTKVQPGTGQWILSNVSYLDWRDGNLANLFFEGHPGVGKTFLTSVIINDLQSSTSQSDTAVAFFYSSFRRREKQSSIDIVSSIMRQLFLYRPGRSDAVKDLFNKHQGPEKRPSWDDLERTLESVLQGFCTVFFVVDALDECENAHEEGRKPWGLVFGLLFRLQETLKSQVKIRILATFRPFVLIDGVPENHKRHRIEASDHDLETFCRAIVPSIRCIAKKPELQLKVIQEVRESAQGMFLLAKLHCDTLSAKTKPKDILRALSGFREGGDPLPRAYEDSLRRIQSQPEEHRDLARKVLTCVTFSFEPLTMDQVRHAVAVDEETQDIDPEYDLDDPDLVISVCAGLVTLDSQSQNLRMVHYTTQSFLESLGDGFLSNPHTFLASRCLSYLQLSPFSSGHFLYDGFPRKPSGRRWRAHPFYPYSARFWVRHWEYGGFDRSLEQTAFSFLDNFGFVGSAWEAWEAWGANFRPVRELHYHGLSSLHLLAAMGANVVVKTYLDRGFPSTPMQNGDLLCEACKRCTSSHIAFLETRQCPWQEAITSLKDGWRRTAIVFAFKPASEAHRSTMRTLHHANGVPAFEKDSTGFSVLERALWHGMDSLALELLQNPGVLPSVDKIDVDRVSYFGGDALTHAVIWGSLEIVKLLTYKFGANVDVSDGKTGWTLVMQAASHQRMEMVTFLAPLVSDINKRENHGNTVFHFLLRLFPFQDPSSQILQELRACLSCLVDCGADMRLKDEDGLSAYDMVCRLEAEAEAMHWKAELLDTVRRLKEIALPSLSPEEILQPTPGTL